nr:uncharacterized protein LOC111516610 [Leptinotarsa decemlineata]
MDASKNVGSDGLKKICNYCKKNVSTGLCCVTCESMYHSSCAKRVNSCCEVILSTKFQAPDYDSDTLSETSYLREENKLLRQIIMDKDTIIRNKDTLIALLSEKIILLENNPSLKFIEASTNQPDHKKTAQSNSNLPNDTKKDQSKNNRASMKSNNNKKLSNNILSPGIQGDTSDKSNSNLQLLEVQTMKKFDEIINLINDTYPNPPGTSIDNSWNSVTYKKIKKSNTSSQLPTAKSYGTGHPSDLLTVAPERNWIWIGGLD